MLKTSNISRSFIVQVADLIFHINPNTLTVTDGVTEISTEISKNELEVLEAFTQQAKSVVSPLPSSEVIYSIIDGPQKISLIKKQNDYILIINSQIQFTTKSEEIYHEALVHPGFGSLLSPAKNCLILGGGDGLAAKQIFKHYPDTKVTLVDFDKNITDIFTHDPIMVEINEGAMSKCNVINDDAFDWVSNHVLENEMTGSDCQYDVIICDFPDPDTDIFNKLYSVELYKNLKKLLKPDGAMVVQSGSLVPNSKSFKCINKTLKSAGFYPQSYYTPTSYGELVYNLCHHEHDYERQNLASIIFPNNLKTLDKQFFIDAMCRFRPGLISNEDVEINTVDNMVAFKYRIEELENLKK